LWKRRCFDSNGVFAAMIVIAAVAFIAEWLLTMIEDRLPTWRPETTVNE
jgi:NitT/TauT family transport system permease protein